jgi:FkbM family methyltransferase
MISLFKRIPHHLEEDVFRGYAEEDIQRLSRLLPKRPTPTQGVLTDAVGVKTDPSYCPWIASRVGMVLKGAPFPSDGYFAPGIEYAALAMALAAAIPRGAFSIAEIGAGWGPWIASSAALARANGVNALHVIGVEASPVRFAAMRRHLHINGIVPEGAIPSGHDGDVTWRLEMCAASATDGVLYWPKVDNAHDAGMAASTTPEAAQDYRGVAVEMQEVRAMSITSVLSEIDVLDLLHIDIQGSEFDLISMCRDTLDSKVRHMFVGTHSRKIEGDLIDHFFGSQWRLLREKPCQFYSMADAPTLHGLTYHDGAQLYVNSALA